MTRPWRTGSAQALSVLVCSASSACGSVDLQVAEWEAAVPRTGQYLEAESASLTLVRPLSDGGADASIDAGVASSFSIGNDVDASGGLYLAAPVSANSDALPGPARARYALTLARAGDYRIWGRIHSPGAANNRFWFQLDGGSWHKWRISVGDIWYWDALHEDANYGMPLTFLLEAGPHELVLADCVEGVWLDRLYITADGDVPPGNDTPCHPPNSIEVGGLCLPSCGSQHGTTCGVSACAGVTPLSAYDCDVCCIAP